MNDEDEFENDDIETSLDDVSRYMTASSDDSMDDDDAVAYRTSLREQLHSDVEAYLAAGGRITEVPPNVVSNPPKKPQSNYGGQPI